MEIIAGKCETHILHSRLLDKLFGHLIAQRYFSQTQIIGFLTEYV